MKKFGFWKIYGIVVAVIAVVVVIVLLMACRSIDRYDKALPEHLVEGVIDDFNAGHYEIDYPDMEISKYDAIDSGMFADYREKLTNVKEWTYKVSSGVTSATEMVYGIFGDNELMAYLTLTSNNSSTVLGMLAVNDWTKSSLTPVIQIKTYTLTVDIPTGFSAKANGIDISPSEKEVKTTRKNGNTVYEIEGIYKIPEVEVFDRKENKCTSTEKDGYVSVENVIYYSMILPNTIRIFDDGVEITASETSENNQLKYLFGTLNDSIVLSDVLGQSITYRKEDELIFRDISVTIPENYTLSYGSVDISSFFKEKAANKLYKYVLELNDTLGAGSVSMPENSAYMFADLLAKPEFTITDNNGNTCEYEYSKNEIIIEKQAAIDSLPNEIADLDATGIACTWSNYAQGNLGTDITAFEAVAEVLIKDSYLYNAAYLSYVNRDLLYLSVHTSTSLGNTIKGVVVYSDDLVSCQIQIRKKHKFKGKKRETIEETNDTYYFYKYNGEWKLVDVLVSEDRSYVEVP